MIEHRKGDILDALEKNEIDVLVHGCNCDGGFGRGIAGQIRKKWPSVARYYEDCFRLDFCILGNIDYVFFDNNRTYIVNAYTQQNYGPVDKGPYVSYEAIRSIAQKVFYGFPDKKIGFPRIGAGLAGGNWEIIQNIIIEEAEYAEANVVFFEYDKESK